jgi:hypothetical protein
MLAPCACCRDRHHPAPPQIREGSWEAVGSEHREVGGGGELWGRRDRSAVRLEAAGSSWGGGIGAARGRRLP